MRRTVHITTENARLIAGSPDGGHSAANTNTASRAEMKRLLTSALSGELTERQYKCLTDYFFYGKKEYEIAEELGVNPSTVCRHIACAKRKLKRVARYYGMLPVR